MNAKKKEEMIRELVGLGQRCDQTVGRFEDSSTINQLECETEALRDRLRSSQPDEVEPFMVELADLIVNRCRVARNKRFMVQHANAYLAAVQCNKYRASLNILLGLPVARLRRLREAVQATVDLAPEARYPNLASSLTVVLEKTGSALADLADVDRGMARARRLILLYAFIVTSIAILDAIYSGPWDAIVAISRGLILIGVLELVWKCGSIVLGRGSVALPPGTRLRMLVNFLYAKKTCSSVFDPIIADMQFEYMEALAERRPLKARWIAIRGHLAAFESMGLYTLIRTVKTIIGRLSL